MYFHTLPFLIFFLIIYPAYLVVKETRLRLPFLLAISYLFYAATSYLARPSYLLIVYYLVLISYVSLVDYMMVVLMSRTSRRKLWLVISIINNLAVLGSFKYGAFITESINALLLSCGIPYVVPVPGMLLPVGLSFYIFQSLSYTIDFYRGNVERETSLIRYATFVALFPRLLAGPIERAKNLLPDITDGLSMFVVGLFKKVALADYLALYVSKVYAAPDQFQSPALILATFLFAWQIYFDFSGYTDMARGLARMM
ncbi:MAG: MBOAT family O-acyltransferase, partial [Planctomycetota bacterium]